MAKKGETQSPESNARRSELMKGNQNAAKGRRMASLIERRLEERQLMEKMADTLINLALDGDLQAIKEINDRMDGKAKQTSDVNLTTPKVMLDFTDE